MVSFCAVKLFNGLPFAFACLWLPSLEQTTIHTSLPPSPRSYHSSPTPRPYPASCYCCLHVNSSVKNGVAGSAATRKGRKKTLLSSISYAHVKLGYEQTDQPSGKLLTEAVKCAYLYFPSGRATKSNPAITNPINVASQIRTSFPWPEKDKQTPSGCNCAYWQSLLYLSAAVRLNICYAMWIQQCVLIVFTLSGYNNASQ